MFSSEDYIEISKLTSNCSVDISSEVSSKPYQVKVEGFVNLLNFKNYY